MYCTHINRRSKIAGALKSRLLSAIEFVRAAEAIVARGTVQQLGWTRSDDGSLLDKI